MYSIICYVACCLFVLCFVRHVFVFVVCLMLLFVFGVVALFVSFGL